METILTAFMNGAIACCPLVLVVWVLLRFSRRLLNAATRYSIWWIVIAAVILAPFLYMPARLKAVKGVTRSLRSTEVLYKYEEAPQAEAAPVTRAGVPGRFRLNLKPQAIVNVWIVLSAMMMLRLALSLALLRRRRSRGILAGGDDDALVKRCLERCGVKRRVEVVISAETSSPMVCGPFRPFLLLPEALLVSLDDHELELVCLHEAAHLARFDDVLLLVQRLVQAVLVWNPLVHWISRQMDLEREIACDDFVVGLTSEARAYASCLTHVAEVSGNLRTSPLAAAAMDGRSHLTTRVELLLDRTRRAGARLLRSRLALFAALLLVMAIVSAKSPALVAFAAEHTHLNLPVVIAQAQAPKAPLPAAPARRPKPAPLTAPEPASSTMRVFVSVTDSLHRFVSGLGADDFNVLEGGVKQRISNFANEDQTVSMWIVWDAHDSDYDRQLIQLKVELAALQQNYSPAHPRVRTVQAQIDFLEKAGVLSNSRQALPGLLAAENPQDKFSLVQVDAESLAAAAEQIRKSTTPRNVVAMVVSRDHPSDLLLPGSDFANAVADMRVPVFPIYANTTDNKDDLLSVLRKITVELRNEYVLEFASTQKAPNAVQVTLNQPQGLPPLSPRSRAVLTVSLQMRRTPLTLP